jgi:ubiquinone/menaquinone biosynthesis C-methylase UbiE
MRNVEAQSLAVKRAEVEFHNFASFGEPERVLAHYAAENVRRGALIRKYRDFIGPLTPFLEIGANAGHTSYMLANEFGADGFALDISADSLRYGMALQDIWKLARAPMRVAGDALHLPFRDNSIRFVMTYQTLSQFMDIESVFLEVKRVLAPGGIFLLSEEPLRRALTLGLYRCPYHDTMKPWERKLCDWGLLGYLVRDVIGAGQEESFGIRQNHSMNIRQWHDLIRKHFVDHRYDIFVRATGWGELYMKRLAVRLDPHRSEWRAARLLGGTLAAISRMAGEPATTAGATCKLEDCLQCPDCCGELRGDDVGTLRCRACGYEAPNEGGVYNLIRSEERRELYPGNRADIIDFCLPEHEKQLLGGWYSLEGVFGNKYRWIGKHATARLMRVAPGPRKLRIRGHAQEGIFAQGEPVRLEVAANGQLVGRWTLERSGLFVLEADLPDAEEYRIDLHASPSWNAPPDDRSITVTVSMLRLVTKE